MSKEKGLSWVLGQMALGAGAASLLGSWMFGSKLHETGTPWDKALKEGFIDSVLISVICVALLLLILWIGGHRLKKEKP